jgi:uncharacterized protein YndB with AHSA1/START domain
VSVVTAQIHIDAPPQVVFDYCMTPENTPEWVTIVRGIHDVDPGPMRVGYAMGQTLCLRGVKFHVRWTLAELDAPWFARWEGKGPAGSKAIIEDRLSEADDGGTVFDYRNEFKTPFGPLGRVASGVLVGGISEREARASLAQLKRLVEARAGVPR